MRFDSGSSHIYALFVVVVVVVGVVVVVVVVVVSAICDDLRLPNLAVAACHEDDPLSHLTHHIPKGPVSGRGLLMLKLFKYYPQG